MTSIIPLPQASSFARLVAENVRVECARKDWAQADAARALGVSAQTISIRWRGQRQWQLEDLDRLAAAMGIPLSRFFAGADDLASDVDQARPEAGPDAVARSEGLEPPTCWLVVAPVIDILTRERVA